MSKGGFCTLRTSRPSIRRGHLARAGALNKKREEIKGKKRNESRPNIVFSVAAKVRVFALVLTFVLVLVLVLVSLLVVSLVSAELAVFVLVLASVGLARLVSAVLMALMMLVQLQTAGGVSRGVGGLCV